MAIEEGVPGGAVVSTLQVTAEVVAIDHFNRSASLLRPDGETVTIKVGPEAMHFEEIVVGDMVQVTFVEELIVSVDKSGTAMSGSASAVALGAQAGGMAEMINQVVATVSAIDQVNRTATLQFEDGTERTIPVRSDIDLSEHKPGEKVVFQVTEMMAIDIQKHTE